MDKVDNFLQHYGVLGMKWGVRRERQSDGSYKVISKETPGKKIKTSGGAGQPASEDAKRVAVNKQKAKASTTDSLSNQELQEVVNRMNLEAQYAKLSAAPKNKGIEFVQKQLGVVAKQQTSTLTQKAGQKLVEAAIDHAREKASGR